MTSTPAYPKANQRRLQAPLHRTCPGIIQISDQTSKFLGSNLRAASFAPTEPFNQRLILALFEVLQFLPLLLPDMFRMDKDWDDLSILAQYGTTSCSLIDIDRNDRLQYGLKWR